MKDDTDLASSSPPTMPNIKPEEVHDSMEGNCEREEHALEKHVAFFDRNHDGLVYPWETYEGFRAIGCGIPLSAISAILINLALSHKTRPGKFPSLLFPIEVANIHKAKHGSDSGVYDSKGRFVPEKFEAIFRRHARTHPDALTSDELLEMLRSNREPKDYKGWVASWSEWQVLYYLCKDNKGLLPKGTIHGVYDGSLFERMAKERESSTKKS
ncbi:probable peroxygenase 4 isoform X2 [Punica granatum]|nr:probable peroxygenase 4 isoform X2 [Punica granatum]